MRLRRFQFYRWLLLLFRRPSRPKHLVYLEWGPDELETEMLALDAIPRVGDEIEIQINNTADDRTRWRVTTKTVFGKVVRVQHLIHIDYGNDAGPNSMQSVTVFMVPGPRGEPVY